MIDKQFQGDLEGTSIWLKRLFVFVIILLLVNGAVASHRAYFQVRSLELSAPHVLSVGTIVNTSVVGSGRTQVDVDIDLIQGTHFERIQHLQQPGVLRSTRPTRQLQCRPHFGNALEISIRSRSSPRRRHRARAIDPPPTPNRARAGC